MGKYARVITDNMSGTTLGKYLVAGVYSDKDGKAAEIENGNVVLVGALQEGEREIYSVTAPGKDAKVRELALVAGSEVVTDTTYNSLSDFINKAGVAFRAYRLTDHDVFSVSKEACNIADGYTPVKGTVVELDGTTKLNLVATNTEGSTAVGKVISVEGDFYVIEVQG